MDPQSKIALITGGAQRVGKAITLARARTGANVVIHYNTSANAAHETEVEVRALGVDALIVQADLSNHAQVKAMVDAAAARFGTIDILVNSASPFDPTPFPTEDVSDWQRVIDVLINGSFYVANAVAPLMLRQQRGAMINIADVLALVPRKNFAAHGVGKAGLVAMRRQFALELAPHVRVNAVVPGPVFPPPNYPPEGIARIASRTVLKRWAHPLMLPTRCCTWSARSTLQVKYSWWMAANIWDLTKSNLSFVRRDT
jgi:NAD(P)-dependent dehydrogenase (short-subunit alcohol dehydrogenase family)